MDRLDRQTRLAGAALILACALSTAQASDWWVVTKVDNEGWTTVLDTSLVVLPNGLPAISYVHNPGDWGGYDLKYASRDASGWQCRMVEEFIGRSTSLACMPGGEPAIAYEFDDLRFAWHDPSGWHVTSIDRVAPGGGYVSLLIDGGGCPLISYAQGNEPYPDRDLKLARWDRVQWHATVIDADGDVGLHTSLALLPSGTPAISYYDAANTALKYAWLENNRWQTVVVDEKGDVGQYTSLAILPSGDPAISYYDATHTALKYAERRAGLWQVSIIDDEDDAGQHCCLKLLTNGQPAISYYDGGVVKFAWWDGNTWRISTVADAGACGGHTSLAFLPSGRPVMSFYLHVPGYVQGASALACAERVAMSGDCNCDGAVDFGDINPFVLALVDKSAYLAAFPDCNWLIADINEDGLVDFADINPFVRALTGLR